MIAVYLNNDADALAYAKLGWFVQWYGWRSDFPCYSATWRCCK